MSSMLDGTLLWGGMPQGQYYMLKDFSAETLKAAYGEKGLVQDGPASMWTFQMMVIVREDMPEDAAYELTKQFRENLETVKKTAAVLESIDAHEALTVLSAELHPGTVRYYKEKGLL